MKCSSFAPAVPAGVSPRSARVFSAYKLLALGLINLLMTTNLWAAKAVIPAAPASLTATAISTNAIKLVWQDKSTSETGFKIDRALSPTGPWTVGIATLKANTTVYTNAGLASAKTFYYRVYAYNSRGSSSYSSVASATTFATVAPPCTFTISALSASFDSNAGNGSVTVSSDAGCSWTATSG